MDLFNVRNSQKMTRFTKRTPRPRRVSSVVRWTIFDLKTPTKLPLNEFTTPSLKPWYVDHASIWRRPWPACHGSLSVGIGRSYPHRIYRSMNQC